MPKAEWGVKRTCPNCEARFYDLQRERILCPECGATFNMDDHGKVSGLRERRVPVAVAEDADPLVDEDDEALVDDDEDEAAVDPLLAAEEEDEEPAGPTLADEDEEVETVPFKEPALIEDDEETDEDLEDEEDDLDDLDDAPGKEKGD